MAETTTPKKAPRLLSVKGVAVYPWLLEPDTRFDAEGAYSVKLRIAEADAQGMIKTMDATWAEFQATLKGPKAKKAPNSLGYNMEFDEEGNETGFVIFNFKTKASYVSKKTGKRMEMKPDLFDAKGNPLKDLKNLWGGSIIKVNYSPAGYESGSNLGVTLRLNAVQVFELRKGGGGDASSYGFGEEEGYEYEADGSEGGFSDESEHSGDDASSDNDDF